MKYVFYTSVIFLMCFDATAQINGKEIPNKSEFSAITTAVFIDNADRLEYACGLKVLEGILTIDQYIQATGTEGKSYFFLVKEIKVNDLLVKTAKRGDNAFVILQANGLAPRFNEGWKLAASSEAAFNKVQTLILVESDNTKDYKTSLSFSIEGKTAITKPTLNDDDDPIALYNVKNKHLTITLYGDTKDNPRRGMLNLSLENWNPETTKAFQTAASFVRYKDKAGNELAQWQSKAQTACNVNIEKIEKGEENPLGKTYFISGTWSEVMLFPKLGYEKEIYKYHQVSLTIYWSKKCIKINNSKQ